jgi:hypothetical protein
MKGKAILKELVMKRAIKTGALAAAVLLMAGALIPGCDNSVMEKQPFQSGLGRMVDLETPVFSLDSHGSGAFLRGTETFSGTATDDVGVKNIMVSVKNGPYVDVAYSADTERWSFSLDTAALDAGIRRYEEGPFSLRFKVWDNSGRDPLVTGQYAFTVKNNPPSLELQIPYVDGSRLGADYPSLDTGFNDPGLNTELTKKTTATPSNGSLIGMVTDLSGIADGYPQIKFWPAFLDDPSQTPISDTPASPGSRPNDTHGDWAYNDEDPSPDVAGQILFGGWHEAKVNANDRKESSFTFTFPLRKWKIKDGSYQETGDPLPVGSYRFQIKVKDNLPGSEEIVYPVYDPADTANYPNQFLELLLESPAAKPEIFLYDAGHPTETNTGHPAYGTNSAAGHAASYREPHPYIDDAIQASKSGKWYGSEAGLTPSGEYAPFFILRVKASHNDGIRYASISVRKEGDSTVYPPIVFEGGVVNGSPAPGALIPSSDPPARLFTYRAPREFFALHGDGTYYYTVTASSKSGVDNSETYQVKADTVPPVTRINGILSSWQSSTNEKEFELNSHVLLQGLAYDGDSGIRGGGGSVRWFLLRNAREMGDTYPIAEHFETLLKADYAFMGGDLSSGAYKDYGAAITGSPFNAGGINTTDTTRFPGGPGEYTLFILSQDAALNRSIDRYPGITIDQESDKPRIEVVGMDAGATLAGLNNGEYSGNIINNTTKFTLRLTDDEALDTDNTSLKITIKGNTNPSTVATKALAYKAPDISSEARATLDLSQVDLAAALYAGAGAGDYTGVLRDGYYELTVEVKDKQSTAEGLQGLTKTVATGTKTFVFAKNTASPRVAFTNPLAGNYYQGLMTLTGTLEDDGPVNTGYLQISVTPSKPNPAVDTGGKKDALADYGGTITDLGGVNPQSDGKYRYTFSIPGVNAGTLADENLVIGLEAQDCFGRTTANVQAAIKVDVDPPVLSIMESDISHLTSLNGRENNVNGNISFRAYIFDGESGLPASGAARWWFLPAGNPAPDWDTAGYAALSGPDGQSRFSGVIATRTYTAPDSGAYTIHVVARDKAGVSGRAGFSVYLDQDTDLPQVDLGSLTPARGAGYDPGNETTLTVEAVADSGILVSGLLSDDDGFKKADGSFAGNPVVTIQYWDGTGGPDNWKSAGTAAFEITGETEGKFSYWLPNDAGFLGSGEGKRKYRLCITDVPDAKQSDPAQTSAWEEVAFILDLQAPEITFDPGTPAGSPQGPNFKKPADGAAYNGPFIKGTVTETYLRIDPFIHYSMYISESKSIRGKIPVDTSVGGQAVWELSYAAFEALLKLAANSDPAFNSGAALAGGWWNDSGTGLPDQNYTVKFLVTDDSNSMKSVDWNFSKDSSGPVISFNIETDSAKPATILKTVQPALKGSFRDANSLTPSGNKYFYYRLDYTGTPDPAGNPGYLTGWKGGDDAASQIAVTGTGNNVNWEIDLSSGAAIAANYLKDGEHTLDIKVQDALGSWSQVYTGIKFKIDTAPPELAVQDPAPATVYQIAANASTVVLEGTAQDQLFAAITAKIGKSGDAEGDFLSLSGASPGSYLIQYKNGSAWQTAPYWTTEEGPAGKVRKVNWRITLYGSLLNGGGLGANATYQDYVLRIIAADEAERETRTEWQFRKDQIAPVFNLITLPDADSKIRLQDRNPRIQAGVVDTSGVTEVVATVQQWNYGTGQWTAKFTRNLSELGLTGGGGTINWTLPLGDEGTGHPDLVDGYYRLQVSSRDAAGNTGVYPSAGAWTEFYIDAGPPTLKITSPAAASFHKDTVESAAHFIPASFTATDVNGAVPGNKITRVRAKLVPRGDDESTVSWEDNARVAVFENSTYAASYAGTLKVPGPMTDGNITSGEYTLYVQAQDSGGRGALANINITVDNTKPRLTIESPYIDPDSKADGLYTHLHRSLEVFGAREFIGGVSDDNNVQSLHYYLGQTPPANPETSAAGWYTAGITGNNSVSLNSWQGTYAWTLRFPELEYFLPSRNPGNEYVNPANYVSQVPVAQTGGREIWLLPLYFRVEDQAGNVGLYRQDLWLDPEGSVPKTFIESHDDSSPTVGGAIQVSGSATDDYGIFDISFRVLDSLTDTPITLNLADYPDYELDGRANALGGGYAGGGWYRYKLAGGISSLSSLSPAGWNFTINSGGECNPSGAGNRAVKVQVFAWDSDNANYQVQGVNHGRVASQTLNFSNTSPKITNVKVTAGAYSGAPYEAGMSLRGALTMEAHVWVASSVSINAISYQGAEMAAAHAFTGGTNASWNLPGGGTVSVSDAVDAESGFQGKKLLITGLDPKTLQATNAAGTVSDANWGKNKYDGKADLYALTLKIEDTTTPTRYYAEQRFEFRIDNFFPAAALSGAADLGELAGTSEVISGTFRDDDDFGSVSNNVKGLQKVVVWFTRSGSGVSLDANTGSGAHSFTAASPAVQGDDGDTAGTILVDIPRYPEITPHRDASNNFQEEQYYSGISIDFAGESTLDRDLDHHVEFFDPQSGQWSVRVNTERIGSGPITLNWAVFDDAGNGRFYKKDVVIKNFAPRIGTVIVYSDIYGKVAADTTTPVYTPFVFDGNLENARNTPGTLINAIDNADTGFTVRKKHLSFTIQVNNGNNKLNYRVNYKGGGAAVLTAKSVTDASLGAGGTSWQTLTFEGADFNAMPDITGGVFEITVWDALTSSGLEADQLSSTRTLKVSLDNTDDAKPRALLHDLNPLFNTGRAADDAATLAAAAQPGGIGNNRGLPGIYNLGEESAPVPSGHIEPRITSVLGNELGAPTFAVDTVSGAVIVRGSALDTHRVKEISLVLGGGSPIKILEAARVNSGGDTGLWKLQAAAGQAAWAAEEWRVDGHYVEWAWLWNSEVLPAGIVAGSSSLAAGAADGGGNSSTVIAWNGSADAGNPQSAYYEYNSIPVELAPFILDIDDGSGQSRPRSTQGWYSFYREETPATIHTLRGYNLKKGSNLSTLSISGGANLTQSNTDIHTLTFRLTSDAVSGRIVLKTGGTVVEAVNSRLTKLNPWNLEQNLRGGTENWDHSRFAHVWRADAADYFAGSNGGEDFSMAVNPGDAGLWAAWVNRGLFRTYYGYYDNAGSTATKKSLYIMDSHDPQKETDIYLNTSIHTDNGDAGAYLSMTRQSGVTVAYNNIAAYTQNHAAPGYTGGIEVFDKNAPTGGGTDQAGYRYLMERVNFRGGYISNRFNRPRVVTTTEISGSKIHVSYYDNIAKDLRYSTTTSGSAVDVATKTTVDGGSGNTDKNAGAWSAIDYLSNNQPIIAYYSDSAETVKLAYYNGPGTAYTVKYALMGYPYTWPSSATTPAARATWLRTNYGIVNGAPGMGTGTDNASLVNAWNGMPEAARLAYLQTPWTAAGWGFANYIWPSDVTTVSARSTWLNDNFGISGTDLGTANNTTDRTNAWAAKNPEERLAWLQARRDARTAPLHWDDAALMWPDNFTSDANKSDWLEQHYGISGTALGTANTAAARATAWNGWTPADRLAWLNGHPNSKTWASGTFNPGGAAGWVKGDLLANTDDYYRGSGFYVALRVDRKGTAANDDDMVHVSFYNTGNNTLVYAAGKIGDLVSAGNGNRGCFNFSSMAVDTGLAGGIWADLSLDPQGIPWISYRDQTGIRVARRDLTKFTKPTVDLLGHDNTGWDAVAVPLPGAYSVADGRLNIETISAALAGTQGWNAAVGYAAGDYFRVLYHTPDTGGMPGWWESE